MTSLKQLLFSTLAALILIFAAAPAQADNKKPAKKETVKKEAPTTKKDNVKKRPEKDKADKSKKPAAVEKNKEGNKADRREKSRKEKGNNKNQKDKNTKNKMADKGKEPEGRKRQTDKKTAADKRQTTREKEKEHPDAAARAKKEKEAAKKPSTPPARTETRRPSAEPPVRGKPPADTGGYDEDAMQDFVKQQKERDRLAAEQQGRQQAQRTQPTAAAPKRREDGSSLSRNEADELIGSAMGLLGVAYRFGGTSANTGFDCSGFMQHIFRKTMQINLPRTSAEQAKMGVAVSRGELQPGDMVFFRTVRGRISHVGLYIGNNRFIHAPRTGKRIEITSLANKYWDSRYALARRVKRYDSSRFIK